jgi:hypothetical protein
VKKKSDLKKLSDVEFIRYYYWYSKSQKKHMCEVLQPWFEERGLIDRQTNKEKGETPRVGGKKKK